MLASGPVSSEIQVFSSRTRSGKGLRSKARGQPPLSVAHMKKSMVAQVIIHISNQDEKSHAPSKLLQVELNLNTVDPQGIDHLGVMMFPRISRISSQKRCRRYIRNSPAVIRPVKSPDQRDRQAVTVHQPGFRYPQSGCLCKLHGEYLVFGHRPFIFHAGKLANGQPTIIINDCAFWAHASKGGAASAQIGKIRGCFTLGLDGASCAQQLLQFDERRRRAATRFCRPTKCPCLVLKTQGSDTARIVHREQEVDGLELNHLLFLPRPAGCLAALGVVAQDHSFGPAIGLGVTV